MPTRLFATALFLAIACPAPSSFAQPRNAERAEEKKPEEKKKEVDLPGTMSVPVNDLLYMGKYWRSAKATYSVEEDAITLNDGRSRKEFGWVIAPASLKSLFLEFRGAALSKLAHKADKKEVKTGRNDRVTGKVLFVVDEGVLIQRGDMIILVEGAKGYADGETYSGRARRTARVYQYLLEYGRVATKRIYEQVTEQMEQAETAKSPAAD